jgi:DNA-binding transcriptional LysR family regulator
MKLRHLEYFVTAAEKLNFTHAADRLHVSQPPFSKQIQDLEGELGVDLFQTTPSRQICSPLAERFAAAANQTRMASSSRL